MTRFHALLLLFIVLVAHHTGEATAASNDSIEKKAGSYNRLGLEKIKENKYEEAVQCFDKVIALKPGDASAWNSKGYALNKLHNTSALACYQKAVALDPGYAEAWLNLAYYYMQFGSYNEEYFSKAIKLKPDFAEAWAGRGINILMLIENSGWALSNNQGEKEEARKYANEAIGCFDKAIQLKPGYAEAWKYKGDCYFMIAETKIGRKDIKTYYEEAIQFYAKAGDLQPDTINDYVLENMGVSHDSLGRYDKALACFKRVKRGRNLAYRMGITYLHLERYREAIQCFDAILEQHGEMHERVKVLNEKGRALKALGKNEDAKKCFDEALKTEHQLR
ncbi:MAG: tetratricopeptide repeat protein [Spirochaetes bacterium]|nr:tetratricopeptide repeat protein [Spirochaetota bacterium]